MIQIHAVKVQRMIGEGLSSDEIAGQFNGQYTVEEINVFRPVAKPKTKSKAKAVSADVTG